MNKKFKFASAVLSAGLLITPVSGLINNYDSVAKANNINLNELSKENDVIISKEMTREELINYFAENNNVSKSEAEIMLFKSRFEERYAYSYRTISKNLSYGARIEFYTQGDGWNNYYSIDKLLNVSIKHDSKSFGGSVYANLESNTSIYYDVEGNLYNGGTTTVSGNLNIGVGQGGSAGLGASYSTDIYAHISDSGRASIY